MITQTFKNKIMGKKKTNNNQKISDQEKERMFEEICERIEKGESLRSVLKSEDMPSSRTFFKWLANDDSLVKQYAHATDIRADEMFEDLLAIADENHNDVKTLADGSKRGDNEVIQRSKLRVDARKWYLSKLRPKKFGDKIETTIQGGDKALQINALFPDNPIKDIKESE